MFELTPSPSNPMVLNAQWLFYSVLSNKNLRYRYLKELQSKQKNFRDKFWKKTLERNGSISVQSKYWFWVTYFWSLAYCLVKLFIFFVLIDHVSVLFSLNIIENNSWKILHGSIEVSIFFKMLLAIKYYIIKQKNLNLI